MSSIEVSTHKGLSAATVLLGVAICSQAAAAEADAVDALVITALKRQGTVMTTPASVTAIDGAMLGARGMHDLRDLRGVPGVALVDAGASNTRIVIRGVQTVGEATVAVYYDEAPVSGMVGTTSDPGGTTPLLGFFDVDRLEVLRGPQGTLYGSGAMSGAVKVVFRKPDRQAAGLVEAGARAGEGGAGRSLDAMINLPLVADRLALRAVYQDQSSDGYIDNTVLGIEQVDDQRMRGGRLQARFWVSPRLVIDAAIHYRRTQGDRSFWDLELGPYRSRAQVRLPSQESTTLAALTATWDLDFATLTGAVSYQDRKLDQAVGDPSYFFAAQIDNPATCARLRGGGAPCTPDAQADFNAYVSQFVHGEIFGLQTSTSPNVELRLASNHRRWMNWTAGLFYSTRDNDVDSNQFATSPSTGVALEPLVRQTRRLVSDRLSQAAAFVDVEVKVSDVLDVSAGARYFDYQRKVAGATIVPLDLINARASDWTSVKSHEDGVVAKLALDWRPAPRTLIYAGASQGFRPGGVNQVLGLPATLGPYRSDSLWNYEIGLKQRSRSGGLALTADLFQIDWKDMQVTGQTTSGPFSFISNAGAARIRGGEVEARARLAGALELGASLSYVDARLSADQSNGAITANGRRGDRVPFVPKVNASLELAYGWAITPALDAKARADVAYVGERFSEFRPANTFNRRLPAYTLVNVHLDLEARGGWGGAIYVENLFDEVALTSVLANGVTTGHSWATSARPRTIGVSVKRAF